MGDALPWVNTSYSSEYGLQLPQVALLHVYRLFNTSRGMHSSSSSSFTVMHKVPGQHDYLSSVVQVCLLKLWSHALINNSTVETWWDQGESSRFAIIHIRGSLLPPAGVIYLISSWYHNEIGRFRRGDHEARKKSSLAPILWMMRLSWSPGTVKSHLISLLLIGSELRSIGICYYLWWVSVPNRRS